MIPSSELHTVLREMLPGISAQAGAGVRVVFEPALVSGQVGLDRDVVMEAVSAVVRNGLAAMPDGGTLTIRTEHVEALGAEFGPVPPLAPGRYMRVTVQDTGHGMDESTRVRAIAPEPDESRGLARVLSIVRAGEGSLWLDSALTHGTRAFLYLPHRADATRGTPTVLLVEDEASVRSVVRRMLLSQGFVVREARDGETALRLWQTDRADIRAVVTDVVMPVMGGRDLARELRQRDAALPLLFISAFAGDVPSLLDGVEEPRRVLPKPFSNDVLLTALRSLLDGSAE